MTCLQNFPLGSVTLFCPGFPASSLTSLHILSQDPFLLFASLNVAILQDCVISLLCIPALGGLIITHWFKSYMYKDECQPYI